MSLRCFFIAARSPEPAQGKVNFKRLSHRG